MAFVFFFSNDGEQANENVKRKKKEKKPIGGRALGNQKWRLVFFVSNEQRSFTNDRWFKFVSFKDIFIFVCFFLFFMCKTKKKGKKLKGNEREMQLHNTDAKKKVK